MLPAGSTVPKPTSAATALQYIGFFDCTFPKLSRDKALCSQHCGVRSPYSAKSKTLLLLFVWRFTKGTRLQAAKAAEEPDPRPTPKPPIAAEAAEEHHPAAPRPLRITFPTLADGKRVNIRYLFSTCRGLILAM